MTPENERAYLDGARAAWRRILGEAIRELGPDGSADAWRLERADTIAMLRILCADFGDNDWPDDLHLVDIIDKHLGRHLHAKEP